MSRKRLLKIPLNKKELASLRKDSFVWFSFLTSLFLIFSLVLLIFLSWQHLPPELPLFYSRPWGESQLTTPVGLWLLPGLAFLVLITNFLLAISVFKKEILIRRLLGGTAFIFIALLLLTAYQIMNLVS